MRIMRINAKRWLLMETLLSTNVKEVWILISIDFDDLLLRSLLSFCFDWEDISNTWDSVSSAIQTPRKSSKIPRCALHFQLCSRCLGIPMKHCLSHCVKKDVSWPGNPTIRTRILREYGQIREYRVPWNVTCPPRVRNRIFPESDFFRGKENSVSGHLTETRRVKALVLFVLICYE